MTSVNNTNFNANISFNAFTSAKIQESAQGLEGTVFSSDIKATPETDGAYNAQEMASLPGMPEGGHIAKDLQKQYGSNLKDLSTNITDKNYEPIMKNLLKGDEFNKLARKLGKDLSRQFNEMPALNRTRLTIALASMPDNQVAAKVKDGSMKQIIDAFDNIDPNGKKEYKNTATGGFAPIIEGSKGKQGVSGYSDH